MQKFSPLFLYNSLGREKQLFTPMQAGVVNMYVCGMTVYDYCHIGHARVMVVFDMVQRWLRASGYQVNYVRNITDIDDKIIKRAVENGETIAELTQRFISAMHEDADALGVARPDHEPRATAYIPQMLAMIDTLAEKELAYQAPDGDVNYAVRKFPNYGKLSGKDLEDLRAGERVAANQSKDDPLDFVLWKSAKATEPADTRWDSRWGVGRPGWHIECSAMSCSLLGEHFDLHGGGADLMFPHHENEIAQSEGASGQAFVNYWMHNGFVRINEQKMSKSLGNFFTIREVLKIYDPEVLRFFILRAQYRNPLNYGDVYLDDAKVALDRLYTALKDIELPQDIAVDWSTPEAQRFMLAMNDDFNSPIAMSVLFDLATELNRNQSVAVAQQLKGLGAVLGLLQRKPTEYLQGNVQADGLSPEAIEALIEARKAAKAAKNFAESDRIRADLLAAGVVLEDKPGGVTEWRRT